MLFVIVLTCDKISCAKGLETCVHVHLRTGMCMCMCTLLKASIAHACACTYVVTAGVSGELVPRKWLERGVEESNLQPCEVSARGW